MFKNENPQSVVKKSYFRTIFNQDFNLGFGTPRTDVCSKCIELDEKIKKESDQEKRIPWLLNKECISSGQNHSLNCFECFKNTALELLL